MKIFGTDGIRGVANQGHVTPFSMQRLGLAIARVAQRGDHRHQVVIGKDTRLSGYMIENSLSSGIVAGGADVVGVGPVPTPAVGMLTRSLRADLGIMITASHNPFHDNGIKIFGPDGFKIPDQTEALIEELYQASGDELLAPPSLLGQVTYITDARARYIEAAKRTFPANLALDGIKIAVDAANGAGYRTLPEALWELGAEVETIGTSPDGHNINLKCGSTAPEAVQKLVLEKGCDIGIAIDGDGDRAILVDELGTIVNGDQILACIAKHMQKQDLLRGNAVVATIMSNVGFENFLRSIGLDLIRTKVGDRFVLAEMRSSGINLGGEQSGHIVLSDHTTTGDGLVASLQVLAAMVSTNRRASEILNPFEAVPQHLINVKFDSKSDPLASPAVQAVVKQFEQSLGQTGRVVIRKSGTEPLIRVMVEAEQDTTARRVAEEISEAVRIAAGTVNSAFAA